MNSSAHEKDPVTVSVVFVRGMVGGLLARGESVDGVLQEVGIDRQLLDESGARVTGAQYTQLFRRLIELHGDESLGYLSRPLKNGSYALTLRSAVGAPNLHEAMKRMARTFGIVQDDLVLEVRRDGAQAGLCLRFANPSLPPAIFFHELMLRVFWRTLAWFVGTGFRTVRFDFAFPTPMHAGHYSGVFPAQCEFDRPVTGFWFDAKWLTHRVSWDDAALRAYLADAESHVILPSRRRGTDSERVRDLLRRTRPQWPDLKGAAVALHMSPPTLQRRLALEGVSYQALKDELRTDIAIAQLNSGKVTLDQLAQELGFTDRTAFQRAFKTWTGSAPGAYRR